MLNTIEYLAEQVYSIAGNVGMLFFFAAISISLYQLWVLPKVMTAQRGVASDSELSKFEHWVLAIKIGRIIFCLVFGVFTLGIALMSVGAVWVRILGAVMFFTLAGSLVAFLWVFATSKTRQP